MADIPKCTWGPLLPGLPNEVTLAHVTPKLGWRDFYVLAAVSPAWCHAIRSRQVYDARVASLSTETLILFSYQPSAFSTSLALYSKTKSTCIKLPPITTVESGIPQLCKCVVLNGKIYIWGRDLDSCYLDVSYVFDLAEQRQWQSFQRRGHWFGFKCAVLDSKIYALGGLGASDPVNGSEVYDPVANTWSPIKPMRSLRFQHRVAALGNELFVYGGMTYRAEWFDSPGKLLSDLDVDDYGGVWDNSVEVYHPGRDGWRVVEGFRRRSREFMEVVFVARGKLHSLSQAGIQFYDAERNLWTYLQSCSWALGGPEDIEPYAVIAVGDELFASVSRFYRDRRGTCFVQSAGFGIENEPLVWEIAKPPSFITRVPQEYDDAVLCPVQL